MIKNYNDQTDTAWKDVLDVYLKDFVEYCLPDLFALIDWNKNWVPLDKELHSITKDNITGTKLVDKLVKVFLNNGLEKWVLIHVEVQGSNDDKFSQRMFTYAYRLFDKYNQPIVSCAILTDTNKSWRPSYFEVELAGSKLRLDYLVIKLIDYQEQLQQLEVDNRPFASIIFTHLIAINAKRKVDEERLDIKFSLTRRLYDKGMSKEQIKTLYYFIDWLIGLPKTLELKYLEQVYEIEESKKMSYISTAERIGMEKGLEQGLERGLEQGVKRGESTLLVSQIKHKFGNICKEYQERINQADAKTLLTWGEKILDAKKIQEIFEDN